MHASHSKRTSNIAHLNVDGEIMLLQPWIASIWRDVPTMHRIVHRSCIVRMHAPRCGGRSQLRGPLTCLERIPLAHISQHQHRCCDRASVSPGASKPPSRAAAAATGQEQLAIAEAALEPRTRAQHQYAAVASLLDRCWWLDRTHGQRWCACAMLAHLAGTGLLGISCKPVIGPCTP